MKIFYSLLLNSKQVKDLLNPKGRNFLSSFSAIVTTAIILNTALCCVLPTAVAQTRISDFDAESIEGSIDLLPGVEPVPVELVEEQSPEASKSTNTPAPTTTASLDTPANEPDVNADAESNSESAASREDKFDKEMTTALNVNDVDITALIKTFSKLTKRNYIIDNTVKGKITIHLPTAVTISEALRILDSVLLLKGFTTVPAGENIWKVVPAKDAKQTTIPLLIDDQKSKSDALVTQLIRLRHTKAEDLQQLLGQFVSRDGMVNSFTGTNSLIIIDASSNIQRLEELVNQLDVPAVDQDLTIIPIVHAEAKDVADKLKEILGEEGQSDSASPNSGISPQLVAPRIPQRVPTPGGATGQNNIGKRTLPFKVIPDERTNALIVVADPELTAKIRALIEKLDSAVDLSGGRFFVYQLQHADAEQLSEMLTQLISGTSESSSSSNSTTGSSLSRSSRNNQAAQTAVRDRLTSAILRRGPGSTPGMGENTGRVNFEGEVSIAADPATNSLIINAARTDYKRLEEVISALDIKRRQVMVEATILEVSLNKEEGFGVELQGTGATDEGGVIGQTNFGGLGNLLTNPAGLSDLSIAAASTGTITLPGGLTIPSQAALVTAMNRLANVNVLSAPTILTTDNEEAEIIVGENVPFVTSTSTDPTNLGNTFNQVERQDVGITLRITPQISTGDFVTLKMFIEISDVVAGTRNDPNGPTTRIRTTETNVEVKNNQMVATGGLISDNVTVSTRGVPYLQDIPVLGFLFKREDEVQRRTNLLVLITPRVIKDQFDAREDTIEKRDDLRNSINEHDSKPDRAEILSSNKIDNVIPEIEMNEEEILPSTIFPNPGSSSNNSSLSEENLIEVPPSTVDGEESVDEAIDRTNERLKKLGAAPIDIDTPETATTTRIVKPDYSGDALSITVKPKLPGSAPIASQNDSPKAKVVSPERPQQQSNLPAVPSPTPTTASKGTFVVLKAISVGSSAPNFMSKSTNGTLGLVVPINSADGSEKFFRVGEKYTYNSGATPTQFVCIGKYSAINEAKVIHPELSASNGWHQLSPKETLQLGSSGWVR